MDACPDFIGVVNPAIAGRLPLWGVGPTGRRLELESRYSGKHFSKVSGYYNEMLGLHSYGT
jgi:hypothetical protein